MGQIFVIQRYENKMEVALVENNRLANYFVQQGDGNPAVGNIYRGTVESVAPGIQAAFVNIGWKRTAYLTLEDVELPPKLYGCKPTIQDLLKPGQSIVVQVLREALDEKGPKISTKLSMPGRKLILVSGTPYIAISKKIRNPEERARLEKLMENLLNGRNECGVIVRTNGEGCSEGELQQEFQQLAEQWSQLEQNLASQMKPGLVYQGNCLAEEVIRDYVKPSDLEGIYVNDEAVYNLLNQRFPDKKIRFKIHRQEDEAREKQLLSWEGKTEEQFGSIMDRHGLVGEIRNINQRKILLENGGSLIMERTEALQVVDVNTGSFIGKNNVQQTILQMNLFGAEEIARQIRLRNWSGIILIDFIDMQDISHREQVQKRMEELLAKDPVKSHIFGFTGTGLLEMTRKKTRAPLWEVLP